VGGEHSFVPPRYTEAEARVAIAASLSYTEALRRLGMCSSGGVRPVLQKWAGIWRIPTDHFDPHAASLAGLRRSRTRPLPLEALLVEGSRVNRGRLKALLYESGLKQRLCELCGQGEEWRGGRMALILDHVNGVSTDNRLENLRVLCPNCNATLDTHCGANAATRVERACRRCGTSFLPKSSSQKYCSRACGIRWDRRGRPVLGARRVDRPPYAQLKLEVEELGWVGTGRRYGVSDNAIRKWIRAYEAQSQPPGAAA
jgi:HNH endonuclease